MSGMIGANQTQGINFSKKQREVWRKTIGEHHRWNVSYGATRSGKTYLDYYKIPYRITHAGDDGLILLLGNTKGTLDRNIFEPMRAMWTTELVGDIGSDNKINLFGRECWALGADKINQISKIQGAGLCYCYGDEITTWARGVFDMLKSRLDKRGACFDGSCNPDHPKHWFKEFLDSDADISKTSFTIDDNPFLEKDFVENLKREYSGSVFYDRFIRGLWVAAEGAIYKLFANNPSLYIHAIDQSRIAFYTIGVDFGGTKSAQAFQCTGFAHNLARISTVDEYYTKDEVDSTELEKRFIEFVQRQITAGRNVTEIFGDSAESVLMRGLRNALIRSQIGIPLSNAKKGGVTDRVRFYTMLFGIDAYEIAPHCKHTIDAFGQAVWNSKVFEDQRLDDGTTNIDTLDAQEYSTEKYQTQMIDMMIMRGRDTG